MVFVRAGALLLVVWLFVVLLCRVRVLASRDLAIRGVSVSSTAVFIGDCVVLLVAIVAVFLVGGS